jgi:cell wall-associated NlpC family hydrolase
VVFKYKGYNSAYHVGIYIGNGEMIHAPRKGEVTRIESIEQFGGNYSKISYRSLIETL